ncbi:MAG TPA: MBL fold metallo-hydrolase [Firmicutes bacterium]|nr:MBL fold metallo-hydrolase [Bacillota bacterium]
MAELHFLGAAGTVTGSCFLLNTGDCQLLVDCGLFQGKKEIRKCNYEPFSFSPTDIDYVILTHSHIDHSGLLPRLVKEGFKGKIIATRPSVDLARIMLPDSGHIQEMEAEWKNRKRARAGRPPEAPLYTVADAEAVLPLFLGVNYDEIISLSSSIKFRLRDAGHILGSAIIEMWLTEDNETIKLVFSGDFGNSGQPIIRDPALIEAADYLILESTYGNRLHEPREERRPHLAQIIRDTVARQGNVIIPAFAIERTQDLLYELSALYREGEIPSRVITYVDSPLATKATEVFIRNPGYYDHETWQLLQKGFKPLSFDNLEFVRTVEESKWLNTEATGSIIISASGMCDAGRVKHHLKHNLWRPESSVVLVGYQAEGTLGRRLLEGASKVRIFGEEIAVKSQIYSLSAYSAHADQNALINWVKAFHKLPQQVFLVHGEQDALSTLAELLRKDLGVTVSIPVWKQSVQITAEGIALHQPTVLTPPTERVTLSDLNRELQQITTELSPEMEEAYAQEIEQLAQAVHTLRLRAEVAASSED